MHPLTRPVDLLAHFLWTLGLSSPPEGPPALLSTGSSCTRGACRCTSRKESCYFCCPGGWVSVPGATSAEGPWTSTAALPDARESLPQVPVEQPQQICILLFFYTTWSCATFLLLWNMWIVRKVVELKINTLNIPIQVWGEARDAALLTHSRWCNVAGPQISLWVARLSRGTCIFKNWSIVDLQ